MSAEVLNGANFAARGTLHGGDAGADRFAVLVDGASAAEGHPAAELRTGEGKDVAQIPEEGHGGFAVEGTLNAVDLEFDHRGSPRTRIFVWWHFSAENAF